MIFSETPEPQERLDESSGDNAAAFPVGRRPGATRRVERPNLNEPSTAKPYRCEKTERMNPVDSLASGCTFEPIPGWHTENNYKN